MRTRFEAPVRPRATPRPRAGVRAAVPAFALLLVGWVVCAPPRPLAAPRADVRPPAVAGQFYPGDPVHLSAAVKAFLADAVPARGERPLALVLPHAGYAISGQIAADGWRQVVGQRYDLVVLLGTNHTTAGLDGMAVYEGAGFRTPLGVAAIDAQAVHDLLAADPDIRSEPGAHEREHSIEVQVPFAQVALPGVAILPAIVGGEDRARCARLGKALARVLAQRRALIVASSDLSHYPPYEDAVASDRAVLAAMARIDPVGLRTAVDEQMHANRRNLSTCACGEAPVLVALEAAKALGATRGTVLSCANSGDTALGDRDRVVGYGAVMLASGAARTDVAVLERAVCGDAASGAAKGGALGADDKKNLLAFARRSIERYLTTETAPLARGFSPSLCSKQGVFVTLLEKGELRGCIGHMAEDLPLAQAVGSMALASAFDDRRFEPLAARELPEIEIEISLLTPQQRVAGPQAVRIGTDGVVIRKSGRTAVFLPQVPVEQGWDRTQTLEHLCEKAGLPRDAWKSDAEFYTFQSVLFRESEFR